MPSKAHLSVEEKGRQAARDGLPRESCPYIDRRTDYHHGVTFSRGFIEAWQRGYDEVKAASVPPAPAAEVERPES